MLVGKSSFRVVLPYSIFLFFIFAVLVFSSLPFEEKEVVAAEAAATKTTPVTKKFYDEKKFKEFKDSLSNNDMDGDGLEDMKEILVYDSDPKEADSNGNGLNDGDEVKSGKNPVDIGDIPEQVKEKERKYQRALEIDELSQCFFYERILNTDTRGINRIEELKNTERFLTDIQQSIEREGLSKTTEENVATKIYKEYLSKNGISDQENKEIFKLFNSFHDNSSFSSENIYEKAFLNSSKKCPQILDRVWEQLELRLDAECSGHDNKKDEWAELTRNGKQNSFFEILFSDTFQDLFKKACPNYKNNIKIAEEKKVSNLKNNGRYKEIAWILPKGDDIVYMEGNEINYLNYVKSGKKEVLPGKIENANILNNDFIASFVDKNKRYFIYKDKKINWENDNIDFFLEDRFFHYLKKPNFLPEIDGKLINFKYETTSSIKTNNNNGRKITTTLFKDGKLYKKIPYSLIPKIENYNNSFIAQTGTSQLYLDKNSKLLFNKYGLVRDFLVKDKIIYAVIEKEKLINNDKTKKIDQKGYKSSLFSFDGKTEKKIKDFPDNIAIQSILEIQNNIAFIYYNLDDTDINRKCSKKIFQKNKTGCLTFLDAKKLKSLENSEINIEKHYFKNNNIVFEITPGNFYINGQIKKYKISQEDEQSNGGEQAFVSLENLGDGFGICGYNIVNRNTNKINCLINGRDYSINNGVITPNISRTTYILRKNILHQNYAVYKDKVIYTDIVPHKKDKGFLEQALFIDKKEVARCKKIGYVYIDEDKKATNIYYTCAYDMSQGGGETVNKITIK